MLRHYSYHSLLYFEWVEREPRSVHPHSLALHDLEGPGLEELRGDEARLPYCPEERVLCHVFHFHFCSKFRLELENGGVIVRTVVLAPLYHALKQVALAHLHKHQIKD